MRRRISCASDWMHLDTAQRKTIHHEWRTRRVIETLLRRLTDSALASVIAGLTAACNARPGCRSFLAWSNHDDWIAWRCRDAVVTDASGDWSLLFSTPFYQTTLPGETLNPSILALIDRERDLTSLTSAPAPPLARSPAATRGARMINSCCEKAPIKKLYKFLLERSKAVVPYGQPRRSTSICI